MAQPLTKMARPNFHLKPIEELTLSLRILREWVYERRYYEARGKVRDLYAETITCLEMASGYLGEAQSSIAQESAATRQAKCSSGAHKRKAARSKRPNARQVHIRYVSQGSSGQGVAKRIREKCKRGA